MKFEKTGLPPNETLKNAYEICAAQPFVHDDEFTAFTVPTLKKLGEEGEGVDADFLAAAMLAMTFPKSHEAQRNSVAADLGHDVVSALCAIDASADGNKVVLDGASTEVRQMVVTVGINGFTMLKNDLEQAELSADTGEKKIALQVASEMFDDLCDQYRLAMPSGSAALDREFESARDDLAALLDKKRRDWNDELKRHRPGLFADLRKVIDRHKP